MMVFRLVYIKVSSIALAFLLWFSVIFVTYLHESCFERTFADHPTVYPIEHPLSGYSLFKRIFEYQKHR